MTTQINLKNITIWRGRREIEIGTGKTFPTIKRWSKEYHFPLRHDPGGRTYVIEYEYVLWLQRYDDHRRKVGRPRKSNLPPDKRFKKR